MKLRVSQNTQCSTLSNDYSDLEKIDLQEKRGDIFLNRVQQRISENLRTKYSVGQSYVVFNQINKTILGTQIDNVDKRCNLQRKIKDFVKNEEEQNMMNFYVMKESLGQIQDLVEYYKYYSQKSLIFIEDFFQLIYEYHQKQKFVQYNKLKILLNLTDSKEIEKSQQNEQAKIRLKYNVLPNVRTNDYKSQEFNQTKQKQNNSFICSNILDDLNLTQSSSKAQISQSLLINRLRNNLSKHFGHSKMKHMPIQELDKLYHFQKRDQNFNLFKGNFQKYFFRNMKAHTTTNKQKLLGNQNLCPYQSKREFNSKKRTSKRIYSCQFVQKSSIPKTKINVCEKKPQHRKNKSMDNINMRTASLQSTGQKPCNKIKTIHKENLLKNMTNNKTQKNSELFIGTVNNLKSKIKKQKEKLIKESKKYEQNLKMSNHLPYMSSSQKKINVSQIKTANQRFMKKNFDILREKQKKIN